MKIAVIATGWHFPAHFYRKMKDQTIKADLFCVAHRLPEQAHDKDLSKLGDSPREQLDKTLYAKIADMDDLAGWNFKLYPNTIGDWGCSNQWLKDHDYRDYDVILFTHDDNYILRDDFLEQGLTKGWGILSNSMGMPQGWLRGSCEFFTRDMLDKMGGKFDLSLTTLTREGKTDTPADKTELSDWNSTVVPLMSFIADNNIPVKFLSPYYRVSKWCIEGERGWIHYTHGQNTRYEEMGLKEFNII